MADPHVYQQVLATSERVSWQLDEVFPEGTTFDFEREFMPPALASTASLSFLSRAEQKTLNQICGHTYLSIFGLVEEFILPFVLDHVRSQLGQNDSRTRALLQFANEEAKHIHLFRRFRTAFEAGFGQRCDVIGPADEIAKAVLAHGPLGVGLVILHIEWMTQRHYVESVKGTPDLEPAFLRLLEKHWVEEAQHAKLDGLIVESLAAHVGERTVDASVDDYLSIIGLLDGGLTQQVELDIQAFERATGRTLRNDERIMLRSALCRDSRNTYVASGSTHPRFLAVIDRIAPSGARRVRTATQQYV